MFSAPIAIALAVEYSLPTMSICEACSSTAEEGIQCRSRGQKGTGLCSDALQTSRREISSHLKALRTHPMRWHFHCSSYQATQPCAGSVEVGVGQPEDSLSVAPQSLAFAEMDVYGTFVRVTMLVRRS